MAYQFRRSKPSSFDLTEENIKDCHPNYKMNPPLRSIEDHQALIDGLNDQTIKVIATDHAPHAREEKNKPIQDAPIWHYWDFNMTFPLLYTYLVKKNLVKLETILDALTTGPAHVLRLEGDVKLGQKANLCIFDLDKEFVIEEDDIKSKSINTPFLGVKCYGKIVANIVNGKMTEMEEM